MRWLASILLSLLFSFALGARFFDLIEQPLSSQLALLSVPALGTGILLYILFPYLAAAFQAASHRRLLFGQALLAALVFASLDGQAWPVPLVELAVLGLLLFLSMLPLSSGYESLAARTGLPRFFMACALGGLAAFFPAALLIDFYPPYLLLLIALPLFVICEAGSYLAWRRLEAIFRRPASSGLLTLIPIVLALVFLGATAWLVFSYPGFFPRERFLPTPQQAGPLLALLVVSPAASAWLLRYLERGGHLARWRTRPLWGFFRENLPGVLLSSLFFATYSLLSHIFNHPGMDLTENFLAADTYAWIERLASPTGTEVEMRAVHPFAFFVFRPLVWVASLLFNGDRYAATLLLVPFAGGICVLLAYLFIKRWSGVEPYAMVMAAVLGTSTSHLMFASLVESYIFSAAALLLFFLLLLEGRTHWLSLVVVGVLTFGITITNFIQTFIGFVVARPKIRTIFLYGLAASALAITLTVLHAAAFPSALMFFEPAGAGMESEYSYPLVGEPAWRVNGRIVMLARNMALYSLVAPQPFVLTTEVGGRFPRFNFFKLAPGQFSHSSYDGMGTLLVLIWVALILLAVIAFLRDWVRTRKLPISAAFPLVLLFNFLLHLGYGYEPFLYSADWTYALLLFVAASLSEPGRRWWFQLGLTVFLGLLMANQWGFLQTMLQSIAPFFE